MTNTTASKSIAKVEGKDRSSDTTAMPQAVARESTPNPLAKMVAEVIEAQRRVEQAKLEAELARARFAAD